MPISFSSKSHGRIPIGFFNIETDMLLMDRYFFFSTDFCEWIIEWADTGKFGRDDKMIYAIQQREMIGNLSGAIYGYEFTGFIGEVYKLFPFPERRPGFKQKPYGTQNRHIVERIIQSFSIQLNVPVDFHQESLTINVGDYIFSAGVLQEIIKYIEVGGMPGWLNGRPPDYVNKMMNQLEITNNQHLKNLAASGKDCSAERQSPWGIGPEDDKNVVKPMP